MMVLASVLFTFCAVGAGWMLRGVHEDARRTRRIHRVNSILERRR